MEIQTNYLLKVLVILKINNNIKEKYIIIGNTNDNINKLLT